MPKGHGASVYFSHVPTLNTVLLTYLVVYAGIGVVRLFGPVLFRMNDLPPAVLGCHATDSIPPQVSRKESLSHIILTPRGPVDCLTHYFKGSRWAVQTTCSYPPLAANQWEDQVQGPPCHLQKDSQCTSFQLPGRFAQAICTKKVSSVSRKRSPVCEEGVQDYRSPSACIFCTYSLE